MKHIIALSLILVLAAVIVIPTFVVRGFDFSAPYRPHRTGEATLISVFIHTRGEIVEMPLEEYLKGVVAAEMPAEFALEALKAQAVAARTYAVKNMRMFGGKGSLQHPGADMSTDPKEGQAWFSEAELEARWGKEKYDRYWQKISRAVEETRGMVLTFNGELINAVYHSTSCGRTESAADVWGTPIPYLESVESPFDKDSPRYKDTREFTIADLEARLGPDTGVVMAAQTGNSDWLQVLERSDTGRVKKIRIGSKVLDGAEVRERLELRSAYFTPEVSGDKIRFNTLGYGHGVGLSQYGANGLAKQGKPFKYILQYYYRGVEVANMYGH